MSPQKKMAIRKNFSVIFTDIQDSILRTLKDMPRPILMILRLVIYHRRFLLNNCLCVYMRDEKYFECYF